MSQTVNFKWPQGEDLEIALIYKEGASENSASAVSLSSGYDARMDIVLPATKEVLYTADFPGAVALLTGGATSPNIVVSLPRTLTLSGGALANHMSTTTNFNFDLFLRNTTTNKQVKILRGQINIERSNTLWL